MIRYLLILYALLVAFTATSQVVSPIGGPKVITNVKGTLLVDSLILMPWRDTIMTPPRAGAVVFRQANKTLYLFTGIRWSPLIASEDIANVLYNGGNVVAPLATVRIGSASNGIPPDNNPVEFVIGGQTVFRLTGNPVSDPVAIYTYGSQYISGEVRIGTSLNLAPLVSLPIFPGTIAYRSSTDPILNGFIAQLDATNTTRTVKLQTATLQGDLPVQRALRLVSTANDLTGAAAGYMWFNSTLNKYRGYFNGAVHSFVFDTDSTDYNLVAYNTRPFIPTRYSHLVDDRSTITAANFLDFFNTNYQLVSAPVNTGGGIRNTPTAAEIDSIHIYPPELYPLFSATAPVTFNNTTGAIGMPQSSGSVNGYLSSTDWSTFNSKLSSIDTTNIANFYLKVRSLSSATAPLSYNSTTGVHTISQATTSTDGYVSSTDWNTFNGKQAGNANLTTIAGLTPTTDNFMIAVASAWASRTPAQARTSLGLVIGTNVQAWDTDLDTWATKTAPSGTVIGTTDVQTLTNKTLGAPFIVMGSDVNGDILYRAAGAYTRLPIGSNTQVLTVVGGAPAWADAAGGGGGGVSSVGLTLGTSGTDAGVSGSPITSSGSFTLNLPTSSASNRGLVSASDWTMFNGKQDGDADLTTIAGLTATTNNFMVAVSSAWASRTPAQVKTTLSLDNVDNTSDATKNSATVTLTNKRWTARVGSTTSSATPTINTDNYDIYKLTAQAADITSMTTNLSGTPVDGDILEIQITGTATRAITWGSSFVGTTVSLPTTTSGTTTLTTVFQYYTTSSYGNNKWGIANYY